MAKKTTYLMQLVNEEQKTGTKYIISIPVKNKGGEKIRLRKYDPVLRRHAMFVAKKMPSHTK